jgi:hypothetical protein
MSKGPHLSQPATTHVPVSPLAPLSTINGEHAVPANPTPAHDLDG